MAKGDEDEEFEEDEEKLEEEPEKIEESEDAEEELEEEAEEESEEEKDEKQSKLTDDKSIIQTEIAEEVKKSYLDYAMSVIVSRALPSIEDGLKPVQRRILYSMNLLGLQSNKQTKKSARIVGDVLGKYHPHGDVAVYDALVRMAQKFSLRYPLVFGQGNFGSVDGDPPAAMRYTEAKLSPMSSEIIEDIDKETVKFVPNFDNSMKEPELLPSKLPNLIINGASGIAVGMATNIPPHNLSEICDAITAYIKDENITIEQLCQIVTGPDFPTGGALSGDIVDLYTKGKGRLVLRGKITNEESKGKERIVITEIPYMLNKSTLVEQIAGLIQNKKLIGVTDLRDESSKGKIRIVLELKKGVNSKYINNMLYKYTRLQDSFNANFLALVGAQPKVLTLKQIIEEYVKYRKQVVTARTVYELKKAKDRLEIVEGLLVALKHIDEIIAIIKKSREEAAENLIKKFGFTKRQAEAILETKLRQLTALFVYIMCFVHFVNIV